MAALLKGKLILYQNTRFLVCLVKFSFQFYLYKDDLRF